MAKDLVCGMNVDEKKAAKTEHMGKTYYFCSPGCKAAFEKAPTKYAGTGSSVPSGHGHGAHH